MGDVWPEVEPRLRRIAAARGIPVDDRDDVVQEVAVRVIASGVTFETADDLLPWAATVLRRIHVDSRRKCERVELLPLTSVAAESTSTGTGDVADAAVARLDLATIGRAVAAWPPDARRALFGRDRHTGASYVRRHRLRARLLELIDGLAAWVGGRRIDTIYGELGAPLATHAPVAAAACLTAMLAIAGGFFGHDDAGAGRSAPGTAPPSFSLGRAGSIAPFGGPADGAALPHAASHAAPARTTDRGGGGSSSARPAPDAGSRVRSPVEHRAGVEAAGQRPSVYVENNEEPRPLACFGGGDVPPTCVDSPVKLGDGVVLPPI